MTTVEKMETATAIIRQQREMIDLYKQLDAQQERTIKAQEAMILKQQELIGKLYDEIDNLHDRLEAQ